ncbi:MAG TPA: hypothetical protein VFW12_11285 [Candidatus Limnocylindria bacterium]|nr:hypothetical protein [Candidatus Limnocylindria bacterium]
MDARDLRAAIAQLPASTAGPARERMRALIDTNRPDVRYLVARVSGGSAGQIAPICASILRAAGAPTGLLADEPSLPEGPLDDPLYVRAGLLVLSGADQLRTNRPGLGEPSRREVEVALALTAFAEASLRVVLLVEDAPGADAALAVPDADIAVLCRVDAAAADVALAALADGRPVVSAPQDAAVRARIEALATERALPLLLGDREFTFEDRGAATDVTVAGRRYAALLRASGVAGWELATGVAAALGVGALGVRMRDEWIVAGTRAAAGATMPE